MDNTQRGPNRPAAINGGLSHTSTPPNSSHTHKQMDSIQAHTEMYGSHYNNNNNNDHNNNNNNNNNNYNYNYNYNNNNNNNKNECWPTWTKTWTIMYDCIPT